MLPLLSGQAGPACPPRSQWASLGTSPSDTACSNTATVTLTLAQLKHSHRDPDSDLTLTLAGLDTAMADPDPGSDHGPAQRQCGDLCQRSPKENPNNTPNLLHDQHSP